MGKSIDLTCSEFVDALASKAPAPGGGGAAALVGSIGMALGSMVGALTIGKPRYAEVEHDVIAIADHARQLQERLLVLVEADARVFEPLSRAYGLPAQTESERARKAEVMETCLRDACSVPLDIMRACCEAIDLHEQLAAKGAHIAISDVGCGVACCKAALQAASLNVFVNTASMGDRSYAQARDDEARRMLATYLPKADDIFDSVEGRLA